MTWNPYESPDDSDQMTINGVLTPGIAYTTKLVRTTKLMKVEPYGAMGARVISLGQKLMEATVRFELATAIQYEAWMENIEPIIGKVPIGAKGQPLKVEYAPFQQYKVTTVMREETRGPLQEEDMWVVEVDFVEWVPLPRPALSAPTKAPDATDNDPYNKIIADKADHASTRLAKRFPPTP